MGFRNRGSRQSKRLVITVVLGIILSTLPLYADIPGFTEELNPNPVGRGGRFTHTLVLDYDDARQVSLDIKTLPDGLRVYRGPEIAPIWVLEEEEGYVRKVRIRTTFTADRAGKIILGGFTLVVGEEADSTAYHLVRVGLWQDRRIVVPYEPEWVVSAETVYAGQAVPVILTVRNMEEITFFDRVSVDQPAGTMMERTSGLGSIESKTTGDIVLYDIPVASYILTPSGPGTVVLPEAEVIAGEVSGSSEAKRINVLPLPEEVRNTGAVGSFSYSAAPKQEEAMEGRELELTVRLSGTGNLNFLQIPDPATRGLSLVSKDDRGDFSASPDGYTGIREITYVYLPDRAGQAVIDVADIRVLDPSMGRVNFLRGRRFTIPVAAVPEEPVTEDGPAPFPFEPITGGHKRVLKTVDFYSEPLWFLSLLPGPFVLFVLFLVRKKLRRPVVLLVLVLTACVSEENTGFESSAALEACSAGEYDEAALHFEEALRGGSGNAVTVYNYAVCLYHGGDTLGALQAARNALYRAPLFFRARTLVKWFEDHGGMPAGIMPTPPYHPDIFFLLLVLTVNGACVFAVLRLRKNRGVYTITAILLLAIAASAGGALWYSVAERNNPPGVVYREDAVLLKIPSTSASPWMPVPPGTSVKIRQETPGYYLVRDGRGVEGWIARETLVRDSRLLFLLDDSVGNE